MREWDTCVSSTQMPARWKHRLREALGHLDDTDTVRVNRVLALTPAHTNELFES